LTGVVLAGLAVAAPVSSQTKTVVRVGYIPSDSFAALYIMADRHLPAADVAVETEPFPALAEERGVALRPLPRPAGAKATPITAIFWNKDWAAKNPELAHKVMVAYVKAARDLALDNGWKQERNIDLMVKYTGATADVIRRARAHVLDPNLDMDPAVLDSTSPTATAPSPSSARSSSR
jgi:ABC-type nitrate/sulfonate/bicarbonate transport system substrate-binding protein